MVDMMLLAFHPAAQWFFNLLLLPSYRYGAGETVGLCLHAGGERQGPAEDEVVRRTTPQPAEPQRAIPTWRQGGFKGAAQQETAWTDFMLRLLKASATSIVRVLSMWDHRETKYSKLYYALIFKLLLSPFRTDVSTINDSFDKNLLPNLTMAL